MSSVSSRHRKNARGARRQTEEGRPSRDSLRSCLTATVHRKPHADPKKLSSDCLPKNASAQQTNRRRQVPSEPPDEPPGRQRGGRTERGGSRHGPATGDGGSCSPGWPKRDREGSSDSGNMLQRSSGYCCSPAHTLTSLLACSHARTPRSRPWSEEEGRPRDSGQAWAGAALTGSASQSIAAGHQGRSFMQTSVWAPTLCQAWC